MNALLTPADIEQRAIEAGITMADVCRQTGIALSTWSRWKRGITEPTLDVYRRIVAAVTEKATA